MSFVLEALKRSEQQRQRASAPNLGSYVLPSRFAASRKPVFWTLSVMVLLGVAALLGWWSGNRRQTAPTPPPEPRAIHPQLDSAPTPVPTSTPSPTEMNPAKKGVASSEAAQPRAYAPATASTILSKPARLHDAGRASRSEAVHEQSKPSTPPPRNSIAIATTPAIVTPSPLSLPSKPVLPLTVALPSLTKAQSVNAPVDKPGSASVNYSDLPSSIRHALPEIKVSGYMIGNDGRSLVAINDHLLNEGDEISPGLFVESIDPDGVVLRYKQYHFRR